MNKPRFTIRKAHITGVPEIKSLIDANVVEAKMLARPYSYIYENLRDFFVILDGEKIIGCVALHIIWSDLAEIKSLAVDKTYRGYGLGRMLIGACISEAEELCLEKLFALTAIPAFFQHMKFDLIDKSLLPQKIWADCINCPLFPDRCNEEAVIRKISGTS